MNFPDEPADQAAEKTSAVPELLHRGRWQQEFEEGLSDAKLEELCNNLAPGGKPKTDIQIERRESRWPGMTLYVFHYSARIRGRRR
jgi:hypothetical protein